MARTIHNLFSRACVIILVAEVLTGCLLTAGCAKGHRQAEVATAKQPAGPKAGSRAIEITVLYDNYTLSEGCKTGWGFSCIITGTEKCILFDTGEAGSLLLENMDKLQVVAEDVDLVVISHDHEDHTGGLYSFLSRNSNALVYFPISASAELVRGVESRGAKVQIPDGPLQICEGVHVAGLTIMGWVDVAGLPIMGQVEQFLVLDTDKGLVVITGCAHPGIVEIVQKAKQMLNKDVYLVFGGFHLLDHSDSQIQSIIRQFRELGVRKVGPSHCTGDRAIELFKQEYREDFVLIGHVGGIRIPEQPHKLYSVWEYIEAGKLDEASHLVKELRLLKDPNIAGGVGSVIKGLARAYYNRGKREFRDVAKAVEASNKACELSNWKNHEYISTLAQSYSVAGDFASAIKWQKEAIDLLPQDKRTELQRNYQARLKLYQSGNLYHKNFSAGDLIAWWKFDKVKDGNVIDSSGNALNGKLIGDAKIISDPQRGNVLSLDGDGDYVDCGNSSVFDIISSLTVGCWIKVYKFDKDWQALVTKGDRSWRLCRNADFASIEFACTGLNAEGTEWGNVLGKMDVNDGKWHHVAGVYDGTKIYLYMDGKLENFKEALGLINTSELPVLIGENGENTERYWNGLIDDVRIYSYALSEAEIKALCEGKDPPRKKD